MPSRHCVKWGPSSFLKRGTAPSFRPMSIVAKTARWMKIPLGAKVGLGPGHIVLYEDPAPLSPLKKGAPLPSFDRVYCGLTVARLSCFI